MAACFHAQQCVEKYLKAQLVQVNIRFSKTHDLNLLLDLNLPGEPLWSVFRPMLIELTRFAVAFRYPGESATRDMAKRAHRGLQNHSRGHPKSAGNHRIVKM